VERTVREQLKLPVEIRRLITYHQERIAQIREALESLEDPADLYGQLEELSRRLEDLRKTIDSPGMRPAKLADNVLIGNHILSRSSVVSHEDKSFQIGDNSPITGSVVGSDNWVKESFRHIEGAKVGSELEQALKDLMTSVDDLARSLSEDVATQIRADATSFTTEATRPAPRKSILEAIGGAITLVAQGVERLGSPIVNLVKSILALIP
jgi:hypothetical protein